jgi:uncharacterized membrane protein (DUF373 family)
MFLVLGNQSLSFLLSIIKILMGTNYEDWYVFLTINLAIMNLDLTLRVEAPAELTENFFFFLLLLEISSLSLIKQRRKLS